MPTRNYAMLSCAVPCYAVVTCKLCGGGAWPVARAAHASIMRARVSAQARNAICNAPGEGRNHMQLRVPQL
eukprot:9118818-Pyramimonas_sp.AAC.1